MRIPDSMMTDILLGANKATNEEIEALSDIARAQDKTLQEAALQKQLVTEPELAQLYSDEIEVPFVDLSSYEINKELLKTIPERIAREYRAVLFEQNDDVYKLALEDPDDLQAIDFLTKQLGSGTKIFLATKKDISSALDGYKGSIGTELSKVVPAEDEEEDEEVVSEEDLAEDSPIAQTVNVLIEYAIKASASDIHIEPREQFVQVRYRVDGVLREANKLPRKVMNALVSRIKILSNLKIDERRAPQDGRFKISLAGEKYALRVSTLPIVDGEKVVMRILDESSEPLSLQQLGFWGHSMRTVKDALAQPHGITLVTGPTGSGKSTTLLSVLSMLNTPGVNISTIEDPVEYNIPGANQTQVNVKAGMTFANGLRALLRQDPNVIMVGEIRDGETANLAIQAALTGHLVFATLHTNNAATAIPRLLDMGAEPFLIASTVRAVIGQRLVRRISPDFREDYTPTKTELKEIQRNFELESILQLLKDEQNTMHMKEDDTPEPASDKSQPLDAREADEDIAKKLKQDPNLVSEETNEKAKSKNKSKSKSKPVETITPLSELITDEDKLQLWRVKEDESLIGTGYKGRVGIYEVLNISNKVQQLISGRAAADDIQDQAIKDGMITMQQDGFIKALQGLTTLEEVLRVTRE